MYVHLATEYLLNQAAIGVLLIAMTAMTVRIVRSRAAVKCRAYARAKR